MGLPARCTVAASGVLEVHGGWCRGSKHHSGSMPTDFLSVVKHYSFVQIGLGLFYKLKMIQSL